MPDQELDSAVRSTTRSTTGQAENRSSNAINLVDTTKPPDSLEATVTNDDSDTGSLKKANKRTSVRQQLAQRKYAKWRQDLENTDGTLPKTSEQDIQEGQSTLRPLEPQHTPSSYVDFATGGVSAPTPHVANIQGYNVRKHHTKRTQEHQVIDVLYENQRGGFFCGIPLYSHSSLLQFDPAPWVNKDFRSSPVNITNAQVPDPSWQWDWKHWYVDMSGDVDEDGWQYSFAFFGNFAWHGSHPWFHSHVRRRRWLRRRVKADLLKPGKTIPSSMSAAHRLNDDYFTIHSKRERSPVKDGTPQTARPESYISYRSAISVEDAAPEEVNDIASLLKAVRLSTIDREKIDAVKRFIGSATEELVYLRDHISDIMSLMMFQNSKRQILEMIKDQAKQAEEHRKQHKADGRPEGEAESRRIDILIATIRAADAEIGDLEYWSDRKHVLKTLDSPSIEESDPINTLNQQAFSSRLESESTGEIKGIPSAAHIGGDTSPLVINRRGADTGQLRMEQGTSEGKGKEKENAEDQQIQENDEEDTLRLSPRLRADQLLIPDKETSSPIPEL